MINSKVMQGKNIFDVTGKVALVTGFRYRTGARGYAHTFAEAGCKVVCADINKEAVEKHGKGN